jgi:hypothetical protein
VSCIVVFRATALSQDGQVGKCMRVGRSAPSSACGALLGVMSEIKSGGIGLKMDPTDIEYSLCKQEIIGSLSYGQESARWGLGQRVANNMPLCVSLYACVRLSLSHTSIHEPRPPHSLDIILCTLPHGVHLHGI